MVMIVTINFYPLAQQPNAYQGHPIVEVSRSHAGHTIVGATPLDE